MDLLENGIIQAYGGSKQKQQQQRFPVEAPEGVNTTAFPRVNQSTGQPGAVSLTQVEVLDMIGEGEIDGLVSADYVFTGQLGQIGYQGVSINTYPNPSGVSVNWLRSVFWNSVPVVDSNNQYNFSSVNVAFTPGLPNGALVGLVNNELTSSRGIGERLRYGDNFAKVYRFYSRDIKAIEVNIRFNQLSTTSTDPNTWGDTNDTTINYTIFYKPLYTTIGKTPATYNQSIPVQVAGKITYGYIRKTRVTFFNQEPAYDSDFVGWEIKIVRYTPDATSNNLRNQSTIDSITEIFGDVFTYPNSAIVASRFSAEYFSQIPERSFMARLLKVKIPSNYDPILKQYNSGTSTTWDGTFADNKAWSDNPAWCYYDLLTNKRYGLGNYIDEDLIDKWSLYKIGLYCDTMVPDGEGGVEPRFTCNLIINSREDAYTVVNNMASIFRAINYYAAGSIYPVQDAQKGDIFQFTNANVENGDFSYQSSSRRNRHSVALVRYNNKNNFYKPAVEYVEDADAIRRNGLRELNVTAFGTSSRGQAIRLGRWALVSETLETETVSFTVGLEGIYLRPGDIFKVLDNNRKPARLGGRVDTISSSGLLLLDSYITGLNPSSLYYFSLLTPTFNYDPSVVQLSNSDQAFSGFRNNWNQQRTFIGSRASGITGVDGVVRTSITFSPAFDSNNYVLSGNPIWMIEGSGINDTYSNQWEYYRTLQVIEQDTNKFNITALQYESGKYAYIESGVGFQTANYQNSIPPGPSNLQLVLESPTLNTRKIDYTFTMPDTQGVVGYKVFVKNGAWTSEADFASNTYLFTTLNANVNNGIYYPNQNGTYYFRVYSFNKQGNMSANYAAGNIAVQGVSQIKDLLVGGLVLEEDTPTTIVGGTLTTGIAVSSSPFFKWQVGIADGGIFPSNLSYRLTVRDVSPNSTPSPNIYFDTRGILKNQISNLIFNYTLDSNRKTVSVNGVHGPFRDYDVVVEGMYDDGTSSAGGNFITDGDSAYSNPFGYDILYCTNPRATGFVLTTDTTPINGWLTDQWITPDGNIKLNVIQGNFPPDFAGAYVYYSTGQFNQSQALGLIGTNFPITAFNMYESGNPFTIPSTLTGVPQAFMAVSLYDEFDLEAANTGLNIQPTLDISNVVKILPRGAFSSYNFIYQAWADLQVFNSAGIQADWYKTSAGFSTITFGFTDGVGLGLIFIFNTPRRTALYSVHVVQNPPQLVNNAFTTKNIYKFTDRFVLVNYTGPMFIGVMANTDYS